jgi:hypothetical protein
MANQPGITEGLLVEEGDTLGLYVDLIVNPGEDPDAVSRNELLGPNSKAVYVGGQWTGDKPGDGYWEAHFQGTRHQLAAVQARSEGSQIGKPKGAPNKPKATVDPQDEAVKRLLSGETTFEQEVFRILG